MPVLSPSEYDISYFEGKLNGITHPAGYTSYSMMQTFITSARFVPSLQDSTGTWFGDLCKGININLNKRFAGKKVLVLACAYGFEVAGFRSLGIDAWGIDVSEYAISQAKPEIQPYLILADARLKIPTYKRNEWDFIFSRGFIECMNDADLSTLIPAMNIVCRSEQLHIISALSPVLYYNIKTLTQWKSLPFDVGSIFIADDNLSNYVTKIN